MVPATVSARCILTSAPAPTASYSYTSCGALLRVMPWLHVKYNYFETILKLFQRFISHEPPQLVTSQIKHV